jgi:hypothetical protein
MGLHMRLSSLRPARLRNGCNFPLIVTFLLFSGCLTAEKVAETRIDSDSSFDLEHSARFTAQSPRMRRFSRASGSESGQFGSIVLVNVGDDTPNLHEKMLQELALANENRERCLFMTTHPGCPSCAAFEYAISSGPLNRASSCASFELISANSKKRCVH